MKLVVGIDPGTNVGLAVFDLEKNLILTKTLKRAGKKEIIKEIEKMGEPVAICTDVRKPPPIVKIIASYFNSRIYFPEKELKSLDKAKIYDEFIKKHQEKLNLNKINLHERDAMISVIKFFGKLENKFRWIDKILKERDLEAYKEYVKCEIIKGKKTSKIISEIVNYLRTSP